jgi:hypothetical protein
MRFPALLHPGEIAWIGVRAPILKPETATGEPKLRPAMILGEVSPGRFMVVGLTSLPHYKDKRPRTAIPAELWAPVAECNSHLFRQPYLWGGSAPVVDKVDIVEHIAYASPELRAFILSSVSNVPPSLRSNVLRLRRDELDDAIASGAVPARQETSDETCPPAPAPAAKPDPEPAAETMTTEPDTEPATEPATPELEPDTQAAAELEPDTQAAAEPATGTMHLSEEVLAALAVLAQGADASNPLFRSTFGPETVAALIADAQLGRRRQAESEAALLAARTALVAARSEISRLADGEPNWGGPETAAIGEIDRTLAAAA